MWRNLSDTELEAALLLDSFIERRVLCILPKETLNIGQYINVKHEAIIMTRLTR